MRATVRSALVLLLLSAAGVALSGCTTGEQSSGGGSATEEREAPTGGAPGSGSASLTVGSESWQFDNFMCVFGHEANQSDEYVFVSLAEGEHTTGERIQLFVQIRDDSGQGRYEGDGVVYEIEMFDVDNLEDPSVHLIATSDSRYGDVSAVVSINGDSVTAEGMFFDDATFGTGASGRAGAVVASCGSESVR